LQLSKAFSSFFELFSLEKAQKSSKDFFENPDAVDQVVAQALSHSMPLLRSITLSLTRDVDWSTHVGPRKLFCEAPLLRHVNLKAFSLLTTELPWSQLYSFTVIGGRYSFVQFSHAIQALAACSSLMLLRWDHLVLPNHDAVSMPPVPLISMQELDTNNTFIPLISSLTFPRLSKFHFDMKLHRQQDFYLFEDHLDPIRSIITSLAVDIPADLGTFYIWDVCSLLGYFPELQSLSLTAVVKNGGRARNFEVAQKCPI